MTISQITKISDTEMNWASLYIESAILQFDIQCNDINTIMTESADDDNAQYMMEAAKSSLFQKLCEGISKIFEALKKAVAKIFNKITDHVSDAETKKKVEELNKIKDDPDAKKITIEIDDPKEIQKNIDDCNTAIEQCEQKLDAGKAPSEDELKNLDDKVKKCKSPTKKIVIGAVAASLAAIAGITGIRTAHYVEECDKIEKKYEQSMTQIKSEYASNVVSGAKYNDTPISDLITHSNVNVAKSSCEYYDAINHFADSVRSLAMDRATLDKEVAYQKLRNVNIFNKGFSALASVITHNAGSYAHATDEHIQNLKNHITGTSSGGFYTDQDNLNNSKQRVKAAKDELSKALQNAD